MNNIKIKHKYMRQSLTRILLYILCTWLIIDLYQAYKRSSRRKIYYEMALQKSRETNKELLVIGDPDNGFVNKYFGRDYGCGTICIDITGCPKCKNKWKGKVENILPKLETNRYVVYVSCVLEYMDKTHIDDTIKHLKRVSGGDLYLVSVDPYSFTSMFYVGRMFTGEPSAKRIITSEYPFTDINYVEF